MSLTYTEVNHGLAVDGHGAQIVGTPDGSHDVPSPAPAQRGSLAKIRDDLIYFPHQVEGVRNLARRTSFILADDMGLGKLEANSEPVLTPSGWRPMGDLRVGDYVVGSDGKPTEVVGVFPQGEQDIVRVTFQDGSWVRCSWDHLWNVQHVQRDTEARYPSTPGGPWRTMTTRQIIDAGLVDKWGNRTWRIPMVEPVHLDTHDLPVDPYLLGVLLGDGSLTQRSISITTDAEIIDALGVLGSSTPHATSVGIVRFTLRDGEVRDALKVLGVAGLASDGKFVPADYLLGHPEDRLALLQGLMDTDGYANPDGGAEFSSTSTDLIDAVMELVQSLGGIARGRQACAATYPLHGEMKVGKPAERVNIKLPAPYVPFRLSRKADAYVVPTKYKPTRIFADVADDGREAATCIRVAAADQLYVTRSYIVTHNSIQALTVAAVDFEMKLATRVLIVCPATLKGNWAEEIATHTWFSATILEGQPKQRAAMLAKFAADGTDILVVNYEQVRPHLEDLNGLGVDIVIMDEAHYIKTHNSERTKAALALRAKRFFLLTGSPLLNHVNELWPLLHRIDPIEYPKYWTFTHRHCVFGGFQNKNIVGVKHQAELVDKLKSVMLRRLKKDVLDLPKKTRVDVLVDASPLQKKLIKQARSEMKIELEGKDPMELANAAVQYGRFRQILCTPANIGEKDESLKLDLAVEKIQEIIGNGRPVVVFTQFRPALERMYQRLIAPAAKGVDPVDCRQIHGGVQPEDRVPAVRAWAEDAAAGKPQALLCMLQVAGVGLNMTAASDAFFIDELEVPKLNQQAEDRLDRIGQTLPVTIYRMRVRNSIESGRLARRLETKDDLFDQIVEDRDLRKLLIAALMADDD